MKHKNQQQQQMKQLQWLFLLMTITLAAIIGFQAYWIKDSYAREKQNLDIKASAAFRQTILKLQADKLELGNLQPVRDSLRFRGDSGAISTVTTVVTKRKLTPPNTRDIKVDAPITIANLVAEKLRDSPENNRPQIKTIVITMKVEGAFAKSDSSVKQLFGSGVVSRGHSYKILPATVGRASQLTLVRRQADSSFQKVSDTASGLFNIDGPLVGLDDSLTPHLKKDTVKNKFTRILIRNKNGSAMDLPLSTLKPDHISSIRIMPERMFEVYQNAPVGLRHYYSKKFLPLHP